jgi:hypothetical protein
VLLFEISATKSSRKGWKAATNGTCASVSHMKSSTLCKGRTHQCVVKLLYVPLYNPMCHCLDLGSVTMLVYPVLHMKQKLRRSWMPGLAPALRRTMPVGRTKKKTEKQKTVHHNLDYPLKYASVQSNCILTSSHGSDYPKNIHAPILHTIEYRWFFLGRKTCLNSYRRHLILTGICSYV